MSKAAGPNNPSSLNTSSTWRGVSSASELLRPDLLYLGPRVRKHVEASQASADLQRMQRQLNPGTAVLSQEMSAAFFEDHPAANLTGAVAFVGCKAGQTAHRSLPLNVLMQLLALEKFGREHTDATPIALVGLESANRGLVRTESSNYESLCRYAFKVSRFIERHTTLLSRVTPVLDCEVLYSPEAINFSRKRKDQDVTDPDRVATAIKSLALSTSGVQLKVGASNFGSRRDIENAKRFASRNQMNLFLGQTLSEDEQLKGEMAFLYGSGPASRRLGQLALTPDEIQNAAWLHVDHLTVSEAEFRIAWQEHEQIESLFKLISELDPSLTIVDESLAWKLDCSERMLDFHDLQLYEISTHNTSVSARALENLKRDYSRAMRTYLRDLAARNFDWLLEMSNQIGFQVESSQQISTNRVADSEKSVVGKIGLATHSVRSKAA